MRVNSTVVTTLPWSASFPDQLDTHIQPKETTPKNPLLIAIKNFDYD